VKIVEIPNKKILFAKPGGSGQPGTAAVARERRPDIMLQKGPNLKQKPEENPPGEVSSRRMAGNNTGRCPRKIDDDGFYFAITDRREPASAKNLVARM